MTTTSIDATDRVADELAGRVRALFGRSLHVRTIDTGSCAACESEIRLLAAPHYDLTRLGFFFTPAPRHADLLIVTGPAVRAMDVAVAKTYQAMPNPKLVVAVGACALGGVYPSDAFVHGSVDAVLPGRRVHPGLPTDAAGPAARAAGRGRPAGRAGLVADVRPGRGATVSAGVPLGLAAGLWLVAAATSPTAVRSVGQWLAAALGGAGGVAALAGGVALLVAGRPATLRLGGSAAVGEVTLRATPLAGVFVALLGLVAVGIAGYAPRYHRPGPGTAVYLPVYHLTLLASLAVLVAGTVVVFLVGWESMALLCYLLVLRQHRRAEVAAGAFWFLALSEAGFVLIVAAFLLLAARTGSMDLDTIAAHARSLPVGVRTAVYLLALAGFGFKAGLVPLHVWLPEAHPVAPADGSALLSGLVVKLGVYGIVLFAFDLLGPGPGWWGLLTMGVGALSAVVGILYALTERGIKRFLAYSTIENVGVILTAVGAAMTFGSYRRPEMAAFLLLAALYHVANHGSYKALLFLEAGVIEHTTGTVDMDRLGGLVRRLPRTAVVSLIGTLGIAALPPLNGFVSEWLVFQGLFQGFRIPSHLVGILIVVAGAALGLTAGLAVNAFVRAYGIPFLGAPRTREAAQASENGQPIVGPGVLAGACVALGVGAPAVLTALARAVATTTGTNIRPTLLVDKLTVIPAHTNFSAFSPTYLAVYLAAVLAVPLVIYVAGRPYGASRTVPVWDGGVVAFRPRMQYSAMTFAAPVRVTFDALYQPAVSLHRASDDPAGRSGPVHYETQVAPLFHTWLYRPVVRAVEKLADLVRPIQSGDVNLYLLYVFAAVLAAYLLAAL